VAAVCEGVSTKELVPGVTYSVYQLSDLLGVSRSPVREAITRLADAGLVAVARNRGFTVLVPTAHDVSEIIEIRVALESPAAKRAAEHGSEGDLQRIRAAFDLMTEAAQQNDANAFWPADRALHDAILRAAGNARAAAIVDQLRKTARLLGPPTTASGRTLAEIVEEHRPVVTSVVGRDGPQAAASMHDHILRTGALLQRTLRG
jgi:DNA-binding GntR family transcriptional regulator